MSEHKNKKTLRHGRKKPIWPIILLLSGGLLLIIGTAFALRKPEQKSAVEVSGAPSLKVDQEKVDLGDVKLGKTVEVAFKLTNVGDQTLNFSEAPYIEVLAGC